MVIIQFEIGFHISYWHSLVAHLLLNSFVKTIAEVAHEDFMLIMFRFDFSGFQIVALTDRYMNILLR